MGGFIILGFIFGVAAGAALQFIQDTYHLQKFIKIYDEAFEKHIQASRRREEIILSAVNRKQAQRAQQDFIEVSPIPVNGEEWREIDFSGRF